MKNVGTAAAGLFQKPMGIGSAFFIKESFCAFCFTRGGPAGAQEPPGKTIYKRLMFRTNLLWR
jgi:hypothetical protein